METCGEAGGLGGNSELALSGEHPGGSVSKLEKQRWQGERIIIIYPF